MRIVLDTNVVVSGLLIPAGPPGTLLRAWREGRFEAMRSARTLAELDVVMARPRISHRLPISTAELQQFLQDYANLAISVEPDLTVTAITADPSDNVFLELAVAGAADYIVSGDAHLTSLGSYEGIPILTPARFLAVLTDE